MKDEAARYGVQVMETEVIGLLPLKYLIETASYYMQLEGFKSEQILETHL